MTHAELKELFEMHAVTAQAIRGNALTRSKVAIFTRLAATVGNIPLGRLVELGELRRLAPARFASVMGEVGISFRPRHSPEFVAGVVNRLQAQGNNSNLYAPKGYREIMRR
jgi:hypothetical protein